MTGVAQEIAAADTVGCVCVFCSLFRGSWDAEILVGCNEVV